MTLVRFHPLLRAGAGMALLAASGSALAHHPTGGQTPQTWFHGLLSGLGHPVIGPDHLLFLITVAAVAAVSDGARLRLPLLFALASLGGVLLHLAGLDVPYAESAVALTLVAMALLAWRAAHRLHPTVLWGGAAAGLFHGYAYGESIVGADTGTLLSYLVGLSLVQAALTVALVLALRWALERASLPVRKGIQVYAALAVAIGTGLSLQGLAL